MNPELFIVAVFLLIFAVICIRKMSWGVALTAAFLPTYLIRFQISNIPFTFLEGMILVITALCLTKEISRKSLLKKIKKLPAKKFALPAALLLVAATISVFTSPDKIVALGLWKAYFIEPIFFFLVFIDVIKTKKQIKQVIVALIASATFIALIAIIQYFTGLGIPEVYNLESLRRVTSIYQYPAAVGLLVAPILSLLLGLIISFFTNQKKNWLTKKHLIVGAVISLLLIVTLIFARTEGAWVGVLAATFFIFMFTKYRWKIVALSLIAMIVILAVPVTRDYLITLITFQDVSGEVRLVLWQGTARLIADNPIFGAGLAGFPALYEKYKEARHVELSLYPHNIFLNFWVETGALGLIALLLIIIQYFKLGLKNYWLLAPMICILIYGLVDAPYFKNDLAVLFWILVGLMVVVSKLNSCKNPEKILK